MREISLLWQNVVFILLFSVTLPQMTEKIGQHRNPPLLQFSTHTLCWTGSRRDNSGTGSGRCPASPLPHRRLYRKWDATFSCLHYANIANVAHLKYILKPINRQCCTFINCRKAFAHPAGAASEFNPQLTVSRDDWIWKRVSTKTACKTTWKKNRNVSDYFTLPSVVSL